MTHFGGNLCYAVLNGQKRLLALTIDTDHHQRAQRTPSAQAYTQCFRSSRHRRQVSYAWRHSYWASWPPRVAAPLASGLWKWTTLSSAMDGVPLRSISSRQTDFSRVCAFLNNPRSYTRSGC